MWHTTCKQVNQGDSRILMVENQIGNLTPGLTFGHNLCLKYPNGSCKPILDIYIPRTFQWYKELFNSIIFDPWNCRLKMWEHGDSNSQNWSSLRSVGVHFFTLSYTPRNMKCDLRASLLACTFASPCLGRKPKVKVVIGIIQESPIITSKSQNNSRLWTF
jgi:hypothetical protein